MLNTVVPILDGLAGRFILGVLNMSSGHPVATCALLAALATAVASAWADLLGSRRPAPTPGDGGPARLRQGDDIGAQL